MKCHFNFLSYVDVILFFIACFYEQMFFEIFVAKGDIG